MIIIVLLIVLIAAAVVFIVCRLAAGNKDGRRAYQNQQKNILVQNGVDIKKQTLGSGKGEYFSGNLNDYDTNYINGPVYSTWKISFQNLNTGAVSEFRFRHHMWIGRTASPDKDERRLVLSGDSKVSKSHCVIYEGEGRLCLADQNSKNHTYVNERRIENPVFLNNGDIIKAGDTVLKIEFGK